MEERKNCVAISKKTQTRCAFAQKYGEYCGRHKKLYEKSLLKTPKPVPDPGFYIRYTDEKEIIATPETVYDVVRRYGIAIVKNVINEKEITDANTGMWNYLKTVTLNFPHPIDEFELETWSSIYEMSPDKDNLINSWQIGHSQFMWDLRQNEKIVDIFAKIWRCSKQELLASFEGCMISFPPEITKKGYSYEALKYYFEQPYLQRNFNFIRSFVTTYDINQGDCTFAYIEGSQQQRAYYANQHKIETDKSDVLLNPEDLQWFLDRGCRQRTITCKAGDMIFWDTRLAKTIKHPMPNRKTYNVGLFAYLSYFPKKLVEDKIALKRINAFELKLCMLPKPVNKTTIPAYPCHTRKQLFEMHPIDNPVLTDLGKSLI